MARILGRLVAKATYWTKRRNSTATTRRSRYSTEWWGVSQKSSYTLMAKEHILSNKGARSLNYNEKNIQAVIVCRFGAQSSNSQGRSFPVSLSSVVLPCLPSHCVFSEFTRSDLSVSQSLNSLRIIENGIILFRFQMNINSFFFVCVYLWKLKRSLTTYQRSSEFYSDTVMTTTTT